MLRLIIIFLSLVASTSCNIEREQKFLIDFQNGFNNDSIEILKNDSIVYSKIVTTDESIGFADQFIVYSKNSEPLKIIVNNRISTSLETDSSKRFIGVNRYNNNLTVEFSSDEFLYD